MTRLGLGGAEPNVPTAPSYPPAQRATTARLDGVAPPKQCGLKSGARGGSCRDTTDGMEYDDRQARVLHAPNEAK